MGHHDTTALRRSRARGPAGSAVSLVLVVGLALAGCADDGAGSDPGTTTSPAAGTSSPPMSASPTRVDLAAVLADGSAYDDQRITTTGVMNRIGPALVGLTPPGGSSTPSTGSDTATGLADRPLYVFYGDLELPPDGPVTVTGLVQAPYDAAAVEDTLGVTLDPSVLQSLNFGVNDAVLAAQSITAATGSGTATSGTSSPGSPSTGLTTAPEPT